VTRVSLPPSVPSPVLLSPAKEQRARRPVPLRNARVRIAVAGLVPCLAASIAWRKKP